MSEQEFNWVDARASCSPAKVFTALFLSIKEDVRKMNELTPTTRLKRTFDAYSNESGKLFAVCADGDINAVVHFKLVDEHIEIEIPKRAAPLVVTLTLDNEGKCRLRVNAGECLDQWQVRRMVLEELFFGR
jgi:hypothetical protein